MSRSESDAIAAGHKKTPPCGGVFHCGVNVGT